MRGRAASILVVALAAGTAGCGGGGPAGSTAAGPAVPAGWTRGADIPDALAVDLADVSTRRRAEGLVKHQRETHCRQHLVAVRCARAARGWDCRWITDSGPGRTRLRRRYPGAIPVACP